jgi:hypothetical protein
MGVCGLGPSSSGVITSRGSFENENKTSGFINGSEILAWVKQDSVP